MFKTTGSRINEAISYIRGVDILLGDALYRARNDSRMRTVGGEISIAEQAKSIEKEKRIALRALLLCHRYYFGRLNIPEWKTTSFNYWQSKSKTEINRAISLFTATSDDPTRLADVGYSAGNAPSGDHGVVNYELSRNNGGEPFDIGSETCYKAIMAWLLESGLASYQWYIANAFVDGLAGVQKLFGTPEPLWDGSTNFTSADSLPVVQRGYIVHVYDPDLGTLGHWLVSLGDGTAVGCNNTAYPGGPTVRYSNTVPLDELFLRGFNNQKKNMSFQRGIANIYNPAHIPNRKMLTAR